MTTNQCPHHWIIETSHGSTSKGVCRLCGEERDFANSPAQVNHWAQIAQQKARAAEEARTEGQP